MGSPYLPKRLCNSCMIFSNERNKRSHDLNDSSSREEALTEPISETNFTLNARLDELPDLMINLVRIVADLNFFTIQAVRKYPVVLSVTSITSN